MAKQKGKQRITVSIYGQQYTVVGEEPPNYVKDVAHIVDQKMREIKKMNPYLDTTRLAVLTAVNIVDDYMKLKKENEMLNEKVNEDRSTGDD
ncbi:cell division protein ZapA [Alkalihalobacillus sp. MEB130]|uniref:cell division protein ZapA n=1 Tax=Alkalihalobacillus sp. MEB130 TaxID=2976704 RepID=UPI0028E01A14|nr:cell division protein ZapA [Alkalihalobacillus sp. MEB130]MDT8859450.1 cell division protein ZapA [Alkalihalobacillus sp. MEB130]